MVLTIESLRVHAIQVAHAAGEIWLRCLDQQMEVIAHLAKGVRAPAEKRSAAGWTTFSHSRRSISRRKIIPLLVAARGYMCIARRGTRWRQWAGHVTSVCCVGLSAAGAQAGAAGTSASVAGECVIARPDPGTMFSHSRRSISCKCHSEDLTPNEQRRLAGSGDIRVLDPASTDHARSKRSRFITLVHAATKSSTNFFCASRCRRPRPRREAARASRRSDRHACRSI